MNAKLKLFLVISAKHALAAVLTNSVLMATFPDVFHVHNWAGLLALAKATGAIVLGAEGKVWIPRMLKWATSGDNPDDPPAAGGIDQGAMKAPAK